jgi:hypothetical protein
LAKNKIGFLHQPFLETCCKNHLNQENIMKDFFLMEIVRAAQKYTRFNNNKICSCKDCDKKSQHKISNEKLPNK